MADGPDFDFVVGEPDGAGDEELPGSREPRSSRTGAIIAVLVVVAVVALAVVRLASGHHGRPAASRPSPSPTRHSAAYRPSRPAPADSPADSSSTSSPPPFRTCPAVPPRGSTCVVSHHVSRAVTRAVRSRFPHARDFRQLDVELRDHTSAATRLYYREIHTRIDRLQLSIVVSRRPIDVPEEIAAAPGVLSYSYYTKHGLHVTSVGVALGLRWRLPPAARMFGLTADPRLCALTPA